MMFNRNNEPIIIKNDEFRKCILFISFPIYDYKEEYYIDSTSVRTRWIIDEEIPIFKGEDREYIEKLINF